ncbi:MAG: FAD-dependent oxidoreductase [Lachnospiraceae bacterium]|nr:FAD-dependent oxidoreductase [Lachnospiraceae bacterium]
MERYDVIVIGAGLSGLTAASLLAKRGRKVLVAEAQNKPGGSCGIFKRQGAIFEQGASMLYGFGEYGFNPHRYLFNVLEEPITVIRHKELYAIWFGEHKIIFYEELEPFLAELVRVFPEEEQGIRRFYHDFAKIYEDVIADTPIFVSPDVLKKEDGAMKFRKHPFRYLHFLSFMNRSMKSVLRRYFKGDDILQFFDKLTSTYCYATVEEAPAVLGAVMFLDNHYGGSYYPAGSTMQLTGKLEKVIEEHGGRMRYEAPVKRILHYGKKVYGIELIGGEVIGADQVIYSGNIWSLYEKLLQIPLPKEYKPTYGSVVYYALVKREALPEEMLPIEMLITEKAKIEESEITVYVHSMDDGTLCDPAYHVLTAIGPTFSAWPDGHDGWYQSKEYEFQKKREEERILSVLQKRYPNLVKGIVYSELATPSTLTHYCGKYKGAAAGPKQMLGQHMLKRQHTKTDFDGLYCCGEGTVMGTGTPAVTVSGIAAANLSLREKGLAEFERNDAGKNYVTVVTPPFLKEDLIISENKEVDSLAKLAMCCQYCEDAPCRMACEKKIPIPDITRRLSAGNVTGAARQLKKEWQNACISCTGKNCEKECRRGKSTTPVQIFDMLSRLAQMARKNNGI